MQIHEIRAFSLDEAKQKAYDLYGAVVIKNLKNKKYRNLSSNALYGAVAEYMDSNDMFLYKNSAVLVTKEKGQYRSTKEYAPFRSKKRKGRCKLKRTIQIHLVDTDEIIGISDTKTDAIIKAKELISLYKKDIYGKTVYVANDIDFTLIYKEPKTNHLGTYVLFMVDAEDVRLKKRRDMGFE